MDDPGDSPSEELEPDPLHEWWRAFSAAAEADEYRWLFGGLEVAGGADAGGLGPMLAMTKLEVVSLILAHRRIDNAEAYAPSAFLNLQEYGGPPDGAGAEYCLTIVGPGPPVGIMVSDMDEVDLEDLWAVWEFQCITVQQLVGTMDESIRTGLVRHIMADLTWDGDEFGVEVEAHDDGASFTLHLTPE
jgi:hypothetical protein